MTDKDNWRWDDLETVFDDDFVDKAEFKEADWNARKEAQQQRLKDEAREAKRRRRAKPGRGPADHPVQPPRPPLTRPQKLKRAAVIAGVAVLVLIGLGLDGHPPLAFLQRNAETTTTSRPQGVTSSVPAPSTNPVPSSPQDSNGKVVPSAVTESSPSSAPPSSARN